MRTYSREVIERSDAAWAQYGRRWDPLRRACSSWSLFPPAGSTWDQWDDPSPSQAAIVGRFLDGRPAELLGIVRACRSWREVVAEIILAEQQLDAEAERLERAAKQAKAIHKRQEERAMDAIYARFGFERSIR